MTIDLLRICLINMLSWSAFGTPIIFIYEGFYQGFSLGEPLITIILCFALSILTIVLCSINNIKKIIIFASINTVIILILFLIKIVLLYNFVDNSRQIFHQLMEKYPNGEKPDSAQFVSYYVPIKDEQCCGIDNNKNLSFEESNYFRVNFYDNCIIFYPPTSDSEHPYRGRPCMNYVHKWHRRLIKFILLVMADLLPISLSVLLSLSVLGAPGLYVIEGFLHGFTLSGTLASIILFSIQINLIILLCVTKNVKILILFLTIVTVIILIIFIFEIFSSRNFIDNSRQRFYELIEKYPDGTIPDDWNLIMSYRIIKDRRCCGIDLNKNLSRREGRYFYVNFPSNCLRIFTYMSINPYEIYR
ncbi:unnamed protein product [Rotaria sp. Silwood2]|nr:unnamed protein product [Rotaria sp. Silwood2]